MAEKVSGGGCCFKQLALKTDSARSMQGVWSEVSGNTVRWTAYDLLEGHFLREGAQLHILLVRPR
jgi:hypothetical protein